ncbi:concanavalin A-like lectin/glucanase domain-containing protein [Lactarius hengduanensis]|nr:concanavalin A-like lectin/glucanase domain-containing protein [Lactarius hengduanensis]
MRTGYAILATLSLSLAPCARAFFYLQDEWIGEEFFQGWDWVTKDDPTHGRVNYVSQAEAQNKSLTYADGGKFFMRADNRTLVAPSARGRDSIRISSQKTYNEAIFVLDLQHMPAGCGTWPAFRTRSDTDLGGIIDIIEGINLKTHNQATLHTAPNCTMPPDELRQPQTGETSFTDCNTAANHNAGCGVIFSDTVPPPCTSCTSYGAPFNRAGGGYFVTYRGRDSVKVWFYPRHGYVPEVFRDGAPRGVPVYPDTFWGPPVANFPFSPDLCDYEQHFAAHRIIFSSTFCGDWAGSLWPTSGCGEGTCNDFVNNNPSAFAEAYWEINSLRVYTPQRSSWDAN